MPVHEEPFVCKIMGTPVIPPPRNSSRLRPSLSSSGCWREVDSEGAGKWDWVIMGERDFLC